MLLYLGREVIHDPRTEVGTIQSDNVNSTPFMENGRLHRILGVLLLVIALKPVSNLLLTWGVRQFPHALSYNPLQYVMALFNPMVVVAVLMQIFWLLARMSLLSMADLSFVLPVTATGYALSACLGHIFLREPLTVAHWGGIVLITVGALLVAPTANSSTMFRQPSAKHR